jgi:PAS domain-containing protein
MRSGHSPATGDARLNNVTTLKRSFEDFNQVTRKLQEAFASLELKFEGINRELEDKNIRLERAVEEKERVRNHLQSILESLTTGVLVTDREGKITMMNPAAELFYGVTQREMSGKPVGQLLQWVASKNARPGRGKAAIGRPGPSAARARATLRTATAATSMPRPARRWISCWLRRSTSKVPRPTVPRPSRPTLIG